MKRSSGAHPGLLALAVCVALAWPLVLTAAERPHAQPVDVFEAVAKGQVEVQFIPRDATHARLLVTNKTDAPLSVRLPDSFCGVPVLAQFPGNPFQNLVPNNQGRNNMNMNRNNNDPFNQSQQQNNKAPQRVGAGKNKEKNPFWDIAPAATRTAKVATVCLDYGHPSPHSTLKYELRPLASVIDKRGVAEICEMLGHGDIGQRAAQLAAWHLSNDMSWEKLANLRTKQAIGTIPTYTKDELAAAKKAVEKALDLSKKREKAQKAPDALASRN